MGNPKRATDQLISAADVREVMQRLSIERWQQNLEDIEHQEPSLTAGILVKAEHVVSIRDLYAVDDAQRAFSFGSVSDYLADMIRVGDTEFLQLEFDDNRAPVVVRHTESRTVTTDHWLYDVQRKTRRRLTVFFASYNKK